MGPKGDQGYLYIFIYIYIYICMYSCHIYICLLGSISGPRFVWLFFPNVKMFKTDSVNGCKTSDFPVMVRMFKLRFSKRKWPFLFCGLFYVGKTKHKRRKQKKLQKMTRKYIFCFFFFGWVGKCQKSLFSEKLQNTICVWKGTNGHPSMVFVSRSFFFSFDVLRGGYVFLFCPGYSCFDYL